LGFYIGIFSVANMTHIHKKYAQLQHTA
jgi:hypothetical protein